MQAATVLGRINGSLFVLSLAVLVCAASARPAWSQSYTFINVADQTQEFFSFSPPQLSDNGTLLFFAGLDTSITGLFTKRAGEQTTTVASTAMTFLGFGGGFASINATGVVAFQGNNQLLNPSQGIYSHSVGVTTLVAFNDGIFPFSDSDFSGFGTSGVEAINDAGIIAFYAVQHPAAGAFGIFTRNRNGIGPTTTVVDSADALFSQISTNISINGGGSVAFRSVTAVSGRGIFVVAPGGAITTIADNTDGFESIEEAWSINDAGAVVFTATRPVGVGAVVVGSGGALATVADTNGAYLSFQSSSINNAGSVAFDALLDDGRRGIFTGPDPVADKVILVGDTLFGETVADVQFVDGLNNGGDIAFLYRLDNQLKGVAVAVVPEPNTDLGMMAAAATICLFRRRRLPTVEPARQAKIRVSA